MNGSEKQIKWAKEIKANMGWEEFKSTMPSGNTAAKRVADFIDTMDAAIWIENRGLRNADILLRGLIFTGLYCNGITYQADRANGDIIATWDDVDGEKRKIVN